MHTQTPKHKQPAVMAHTLNDEPYGIQAFMYEPETEWEISWRPLPLWSCSDTDNYQHVSTVRPRLLDNPTFSHKFHRKKPCPVFESIRYMLIILKFRHIFVDVSLMILFFLHLTP
uniref:Uncharacterized protein n=1 Tax=Sparus aurata TaxID=8175 RepID=A0A671TVU6_SPAAU